MGHAQVRLRWAVLAPKALSLSIHNVDIEATTRHVPQVLPSASHDDHAHRARCTAPEVPLRVWPVQHCPVEAWEREQQEATASQRAAKLLAVDSILWGGRPRKDLTGQLRAAIKRHIIFQLMRLLEVCALTELHAA